MTDSQFRGNHAGRFLSSRRAASGASTAGPGRLYWIKAHPSRGCGFQPARSSVIGGPWAAACAPCAAEAPGLADAAGAPRSSPGVTVPIRGARRGLDARRRECAGMGRPSSGRDLVQARRRRARRLCGDRGSSRGRHGRAAPAAERSPGLVRARSWEKWRSWPTRPARRPS